MLNLTDYVHHCVCTNELSNLCLVREQLNSYKVNHSFFVCCFRFNQTFNASTYFKQTVLFPRLNFSMHVNWFYHKKELWLENQQQQKIHGCINLLSHKSIYTRQPFLESNSDTPLSWLPYPNQSPPAWYLLIIDWSTFIPRLHDAFTCFSLLCTL